MNGPNYLVCLSPATHSSLQGNSVSYWAHLQVTKKIKCCEKSPRCQMLRIRHWSSGKISWTLSVVYPFQVWYWKLGWVRLTANPKIGQFAYSTRIVSILSNLQISVLRHRDRTRASTLCCFCLFFPHLNMQKTCWIWAPTTLKTHQKVWFSHI